ncbi:hypothetical protein U1Q18_042170 [Sarracenia purpurea var. burkii]
MDYCLPYTTTTFVLESLPSAVKNTVKSSSRAIHGLVSTHKPPIPAFFIFPGHRRFELPIRFGDRNSRRSLIPLASAGASNCEFSSLNTPLEPKSTAGKILSSVLQNDAEYFSVAVGEQLEQLASDRDQAVGRMNLSFGSDEACLHRRIAEVRERECQIAVEDVMYMSVLYKFKKIGVHLIPRLCRCIYNGRLEIWPSNDWALESIHSFEVLEMIREHLTTVVGWRANSNVTMNWATTQIPRFHLCRVYAASILYGYFLKSASLRHYLELSLAEANYDLGLTHSTPLPLSESWWCRLKNIAFGRINNTRSKSAGQSVGQESCSRGKKSKKLRCYLTGFDPETLQMCAKPKTKEAASLIEKHSCALFGDEKMGLVDTNEVILTSLSSLKRMVLEAVAFGSFLWDTEEYVDTVYKLKEN